jgi:hypothetical protein
LNIIAWLKIISMGLCIVKKDVDVGYTLFKPIGVKNHFTRVDLTKKQVTGTVSYNKIIYMTVLVDLITDTVSVEGSVDELKGLAMESRILY